MSVDPLSAVFGFGKAAIERIWPDAETRAIEMRKLEELKQNGDLKRLELHVQLLLAQIETNKQESQHKSLFVAGWRPAVGWVCVSILAFNYIGVYFFELIAAYMQAGFAPPKRMDMSELWPVLIGMLGIGGMRSFDKTKGVQTDSINDK